MDQFIDFLFEEWPLTLGFVFIVILIGRSFLEPILSGVKDMKPQDAVRIMNDDDTLVLDVRLEKEYKEGHILDATHIPVGALESRIKEISEYKSKPVVIYCQTGMRSKQAGGILKKHGFETMYNIAGGLNGWINANLPVNKGTKKKAKK
ncbi:MAG: rhodanese-like domain-containing protein [Gammaproteobacteria bacterium]|nr:rhodanese-like domain-containing protein [Gammaproteobacteria bacterium]